MCWHFGICKTTGGPLCCLSKFLLQKYPVRKSSAGWRQNSVPTRLPCSAELVLIVSWGSSKIPEQRDLHLVCLFLKSKLYFQVVLYLVPRTKYPRVWQGLGIDHENQDVLRATDYTSAASWEEDRICSTARLPTSNVACGFIRTSF